MEGTLFVASVRVDDDFLPKSQAQSSLITNGINHPDPQLETADTEIEAPHSFTYTSLRDLLPLSPPPSIIVPPYDRKDSWREIPIKDPLLQHAAWAYLRPMSTASEEDDDYDGSCAAVLTQRCRGLFGCFGELFNDVVWTRMKSLFSENENADKYARKVD